MKRHALAVGRCPNGGKLQFASAARARRKARLIREDPHVENRHQRAYQCPSCGFWHLTSQRQP